MVDDKEEEVTYKVADKRKFNPDGSVREGITLDAAPPEKPRIEPKAATNPAPSAGVDEEALPPAGSDFDELGDEDVDEVDDASDIPGARDPASFVNFLSTLATNAAAALGAVPHPVTGKRTDRKSTRLNSSHVSESRMPS